MRERNRQCLVKAKDLIQVILDDIGKSESYTTGLNKGFIKIDIKMLKRTYDVSYTIDNELFTELKKYLKRS